MDGKKYVRCVHKAMVTCKLDPRKDDVDKEEKVFVFYPFVLNKYTGQPEHTGYTMIDDADAVRLQKESKLFQAFAKQKLLFIHDDLPASAQSATDIIQTKNKEILELRKEIAEMKAGGAYSKADVDAAVKDALAQADAKLAEVGHELEEVKIALEEAQAVKADASEEGKDEEKKEDSQE